ncbi:1,3,6,8-tetrahydroxynaphthalene synthase [bioreactor metagenome]|uniref:1,3,6,8-tetrahydroxynaphthalene synthase n=1 Tax=bioreactor metagenome TaxID=1076179 RepID=A0A645H7T9_9ZZZZ
MLGEACRSWGLTQTEIGHYVVHPGGAKVLTAYSESLGLINGELADAEGVLEHYGNMSSASVFFVLEQFLANSAADNRYGVMLGLGPGFSAEQVLFRW